MTKKILLVLLVVLMVGILAFSVFACNKKDPPKTPNGPSNTPGTGDDVIDDTDYFTLMIEDVIAAIDNTVANVNDIDTAASVNAEIYVDVVVGQDAYNVKLNVSGSIDKNAKAKNWALIEADVLGVKVNLFAVNNGQVEDLYIAQNVLNENVKWNKLSQFEQANVLSNLACNSIIDLVAGLDETTVTNIENGLVNSLAGDILGMLPLISGFGLFAPVEGGAKDFTTADGYQTSLQLGAISDLLASPTISNVIAGLPADYHGIISTAVGLLLGGELEFTNGGATYTPGAAEDTPTIELGFGVKDDLFTGLVLSYALPELSVEFGIKNLALSGASKAAPAPYGTVAPEELAIALDLDLTVPGLVEDVVAAEIAIYPNVKMTFDNDGYVALDLSGLYAVATADIAGENYTIAEYNLNPEYPEDLFIDLGPIINAINENASADLRSGVYPINDVTVFRVPVDLQAKFDAMIAEQKAPKTEGEAQNAINGKNVVDYVIADVIPGLFNEDGSFNIGAVVGVLGQLPAIIEEITPILETEGLFSYELGEDEATATATINLEVLMDALLADNGIIDTIEGDWNNFDLYNAEGTKENFKLADILKEADVLENIVAFVNTLIYENYEKNFVPATEGEEALSYVDYFASDDAPAQLTENMVVLAIKQLAGATVVADEFYTGLEATVNGYAQNGIGASLELAIADGKLGIGIGAKIITNVAKTAETYPAIYYMGDQNGYAMVDQFGTVSNIKVSSNTGNDGGKLLVETLLLMAQGACNIADTYLDQNIYGIAPEGQTPETAIAYNVGETKQVTFGMMGPSLYYFVLTAEKDGTLVFTAEDLTAGLAGLVINANEPIMGRPASYAISEVEVTAGQTYIFAVGSANGFGYAQVNVLVDYKAAE